LNNVRLPNKNLLDLGGMPLLNWAIKSVDCLKDVDNYIWCSKPSIVKSVISDKVRFMRRPKTLDEDNVLGEDIYRSFASRVEADAYLLYHVTSPLMKLKYLREAVDAVTQKGYDSAFSVFPVQTFCWFGGKPLNFQLGAMPRTQDLKPVQQLTSGFFLFTREVIMQGGCRIGQKPKAIEVDYPSSIDIDYKIDYDIARLLVEAAA
jgi:CMP-N-acetylneuraminic acid synthetase